MPSLYCCSRCCGLFSIAGVVFIGWVGLLLDYQPLYVHGTHHHETPTTDKHDVALQAYYAAGAYAVCILLSGVCFIVDKNLSQGLDARTGYPLATRLPSAEATPIGSLNGDGVEKTSIAELVEGRPRGPSGNGRLRGNSTRRASSPLEEPLIDDGQA